MSDGTPTNNSSEHVKPPFTPQMRHIVWLGLAVFGLFLILFAVNLFTDVPLTISKETTYITEPLTPDGTRVDYFAAMEQYRYPPEMQTDDNGYRMVVRELAFSSDVTPAQRQHLYEKFGLDPLILPTLKLEDPAAYLRRYATKHSTGPDVEELVGELEGKVGKPWTFEDRPEMADWLTENDTALDRIANGVRQQVYYVPWLDEDNLPLFELTLLDIQRPRHFARAFQERANFRIANGEIDLAIDDAVSIRRLGRFLGQKGALIECLVGIAVQSISVATPIAGSLEYPPSEAQLRRYVEELNRLPQAVSFEEAMTVEKLTFCDFIQHLAHDRGSKLIEDMGLDIPWGDWPLGVNWNVVAEEAILEYDNIMGGSTPTTKRSSTWMLFRASRSRVLGSTLANGLAPAFDSIREPFHRMDCQDNLLRIVLAMLLYEKQHGTLPPEFSADAQGKPLHSWRVLLLPFLGEQELYDKLRLEEPWDSPHNQKFHAEEVAVFQCPSEHGGPGETTCTVISGDTTAFHGSVGKRLDGFGPKSANMILVAERKTPVCWMAPTQEVPFADALMGINRHSGTLPSGGLGSPHPGGMHVALRSASVTFLSENIDPDQFAALMQGTDDLLP